MQIVAKRNSEAKRRHIFGKNATALSRYRITTKGVSFVYAKELEFCVQLTTALELIEKQCTERLPEYPDFKNFVLMFLNGVRISLPDGSVVAHPDGSPVHGIREQIAELYDVMQILELEAELGMEDLMEGEEGGQED